MAERGSQEPNTAESQIRVLRRATSILDALAASDTPVGLAELGRSVGLSKSTTHGILSTLLTAGLVTRVPATKQYRLGVKVLTLGWAFLRSVEVRGVARPFMTDLRDTTGETVSLHIRVGWQRTPIDQVVSAQPVRRVVELGRSLPLNVGNAGLVLLAGLSDPEFSAYAKARNGLGRHDKGYRKALADRARNVRDLGYSVANPERVEGGVGSVAAPIFDHEGQIAAGLVVSGPEHRWTTDAIEAHLPDILRSATAISEQLGWTPASLHRPPPPRSRRQVENVLRGAS